MPRYKPRLPFATGRGGDPVLEISCADWRRIEKKCGYALDPNVRDELAAATWKFLAFTDSEEKGESFADAKARLNSIKNAAAQLRDAVLEGNMTSDAKAYATHLINRCFTDTRITGKLAVVGSVMVSLVMACEEASQRLANEVHTGRRKGATRQQWLVDLSKIAAKHGLPITARKDTDKSDRSSPFVALVNELQSFLPKKYRRSPGTLAKAIHHARNASGRERLVEATNKSRTRSRE
jgi:hypothetical protein